MKITLEKVKEVISKSEAELRELGVKSLSVFGSVVKGEATSESDIDLLIEFDQPVGLFQFLGVKYFLEDRLKTKVDLATLKALHPMLKDEILREAIRVA